MLKRRDFVKTSVVVAAAASAGVFSANAASQRQSAIHFVLVDEELEDSVAFARELVARGARSFAVQDDIGRLWFGELGAAFAAGHAIAGLTSHTELMVSAEFARLRGARIRYEGTHDCRGAETLTHSLRIDPAFSHLSASLAVADASWPTVVAAQLASAPRSVSALCDASCRSSARRSATNPGSMFSWLIA